LRTSLPYPIPIPIPITHHPPPPTQFIKAHDYGHARGWLTKWFRDLQSAPWSPCSDHRPLPHHAGGPLVSFPRRSKIEPYPHTPFPKSPCSRCARPLPEALRAATYASRIRRGGERWGATVLSYLGSHPPATPPLLSHPMIVRDIPAVIISCSPKVAAPGCGWAGPMYPIPHPVTNTCNGIGRPVIRCPPRAPLGGLFRNVICLIPPSPAATVGQLVISLVHYTCNIPATYAAKIGQTVKAVSRC
jgi:hypothetical protein